MKTTVTAAALALAGLAPFLATAALAQARAPARAAAPAAAAPAAAGARPAAAPLPQGPAITGLCILSQERAIGVSAAGQAANARMRTLVQTVQAELKPEQDSLEAEAKTFQAQQAALTPEQRQQRGAALQQRATAFEQKSGLRQRELQATQQKALQRIATELDPVVRSLYGARNCSVLVNADQAILVSNPAMDITDAVVSQLNTKLPTVTFDRERLDTAAPAAAPAR